MSNHEEKVNIKIPKKSGFSHILFNLAAAGYTHIVVEYCGSGDSGAVESVRAYEKGMIEETGEGDETQMTIVAGEGKPFEDELNTRIEEHVYENVLDRLSNWVNNDGGQGSLIISTADGRYYCDHSYNTMQCTPNPSSGQLGD